MKYLAEHYYHIYNRGVDHQPIFQRRQHYLFLLKTIKLFAPHYHISLLAYCLMPNHYHFLAYNKKDGELGHFLQRVFNCYVQAYNRQTGRKGTLFEHSAKSKFVDSDEYILQVARYIHLNPVQAKLVTSPEEWEFSNYREWIGKRNGTLFDQEFIQSYFPLHGQYEEFVKNEISEKQTALLKRYIE